MIKLSCLLSLVVVAAYILPAEPVFAASPRGRQPAARGAVYPQFHYKDGRVARWIAEQMPVKVYVAPGYCLDQFTDDQIGAPVMNTDNTNAWPDLVKGLMDNPSSITSLPVADNFSREQLQAAVAGISMWKPFEQEGYFSYVFTDDPTDADIYVFWTHHFVNKMGLALFANDIRGQTAQYLLPLQACLADPEKASRSMKPVVIYLRTSESDGKPMSYGKMRAAAAHEFGHALGIIDHSNNPVDLMSKYYGNGVISINDAATIRYLYRLVPQLIP